MSDAELRDELVTLMLAGHDTTANTLAWCFDLVLRHPAVEHQLVAEEATGGRAYTEATITETLRLRPVVPFTGRIAGSDVVLGGYRVPAGTRVWQPALLLQRDAEAFPEPLRFQPERWVDTKAPSFAWIPFGGGIRRCIGAAFAGLEMRVVLQQVLARTELHVLDAHPERPKLNNVILVPRRGVRVRLAGRR
jgi:cytochrome P450